MDWIFIYNPTFCPHRVFMYFVWIWEQTAIISLYSINWLVFITETESVYFAVRTGSLYVIQANRRLLALPWLRRCSVAWCHSGDAGLSQVIPFDICCAQSGTGKSFPASISVFHCQYHSISVPHSPLFLYRSYQKDKRAKSGNLPKSNPLS